MSLCVGKTDLLHCGVRQTKYHRQFSAILSHTCRPSVREHNERAYETMTRGIEHLELCRRRGQMTAIRIWPDGIRRPFGGSYIHTYVMCTCAAIMF